MQLNTKQGGNHMAIYIPKYDGYIADVATVDFIRCDGTVFNFDE